MSGGVNRLRLLVDDVVVVAGYHVEAIDRAANLMATSVRVLQNPAPERGQLSSLLVALKAIDHPGVSAMLVTLVDLPLVLPATVRAVLEGYRRTGGAIRLAAWPIASSW